MKADVSATDDVGVVRVDYLVDGKRVAYDSSAPDFEESWDSRLVADGTHSLVAEARDAAGNVGRSSAVVVVVANSTPPPPTTTPTSPTPTPSPSGDSRAPVVSVLNPSATTLAVGSIRVDALASDDVGVVVVEYYVDGRLVARDDSAPDWDEWWDTTSVSDGEHTLVARARDAAGNTGESAAVVFRVANAASPAPPAPTGSCERPYADSSPWNTPIGTAPSIHPNSAFHVSSMTPLLTSDPSQYTYPVYYVTSSTPKRSVYISGRYSNVTSETSITLQKGQISVPIPATAEAAAGSDAQVIILNRETGDEWGFWRLAKSSTGAWQATNGYHYNTRWSGVPPRGFGSRGAGVPYLAGLIRPCEIARGRIDHALAFAYDYPTARYVWPATKSDGKGTDPNDMPEGARLQLDPSLTRDQLIAMGITGPALVVAEALQRYGMYIIDASGREKVMFEYEGTARWNGLITSKTVNAIPLHRFRWVVAG